MNALEDAETVLRQGLAPVEDVLETYGVQIVRSGDLPELVELLDALEPSGRMALANWITDANLQNGSAPTSFEGADGASPLDRLDLTDAADILAEPEKLQRPEEVIPHIVPRRSLVVVSGRPNTAGKTSLLADGCRAVAAGGRFLGKQAPAGTALWAMAEGDERHLGRYLAQVGAELHPGQLQVLRCGHHPLEELETAADLLEPDVIVVDSLGTFLAPLDVDLYTEEVVPPLRRLERVARTGPGVALIHHPRKADDDPAGSHKIVAVADLVRTVKQGRHDRERVMAGHGRWRLPEVRWQMKVTGDHPDVPDLETVRFEVVDPDREIEEKILDFIDANPDASKSAILDGVSGYREKKVDALETLEEQGIVEVDRSGRAFSYRIRENPRSHGTATTSHDNSHGPQGQGGDTVANGSPPSFREGGPQPRSPEAPEPDTEGKCPECGSKIGPSADKCGSCRRDDET